MRLQLLCRHIYPSNVAHSFHVKPGRKTFLPTDKSYRTFAFVRDGGDPQALPDEKGPLPDILYKCPMLEQLAHDMRVARGEASIQAVEDIFSKAQLCCAKAVAP